MLVVAALRHRDPRTAVDPLTGVEAAADRAASASPAELCALEHALRIAEALGGRCVAVTVGAAGATGAAGAAGASGADGMLREALAAGAHGVLRAEGPDHDGAATAYTLHRALLERYGPPDLVVCGERSVDRGTGSTPAFLAARLGAAQALGLTDLTVEGAALRAVRRLDGGRREALRVPLPAVCSVEDTGVRPRRAPLPAVLAARRADVPVVRVDPPGPPGSPDHPVRTVAVRPYRPRPKVLPAPTSATARERMLALTGTFAQRAVPRTVTVSDPVRAVDELLAFLRANGYLRDEEP